MAIKSPISNLFRTITLVLMPGSLRARKMRWARLVDQGVESCRANDLAQAEGYFRSALVTAEDLDSIGPERGTSLYNIARVLSDRGQLEESESAHRKALELFEETGFLNRHVHRSAVDLARVLRAQDQHNAAIERLRRCLAVEHHDQLTYPSAEFVELLEEVGRTFVEKGDLESAAPILTDISQMALKFIAMIP